MRNISAACGAVAVSLALGACGGGSSTTASSPEPTIHSAQPGEPTLISVPGYSYEDNSSMTEVLKSMQESKGYEGSSAHEVTQNGEPVGALVLHEATPALVRSVESGKLNPTKPPPGTDDSFTIAGVRVHVIERYGSPKGTLWMWYHEGTFAQFIPAGQAMGFVEAYLEEANNK
jgi:hypothetical protein